MAGNRVEHGGYVFPVEDASPYQSDANFGPGGGDASDVGYDIPPPSPAVAAPAAPAAPGSTQRITEEQMTPDQRASMGIQWQSGIKGGNQKTTNSVTNTIEGAMPRDPNYDAFREGDLAEKKAIAGMEAEQNYGAAQHQEQLLAQRAAQEQVQLADAQLQASEAERAAQESMSELDSHLKGQREQWLRGERPSGMFSGSDSGAVLSAVGVALAGLGDSGNSANAMNMVNGALDRSIRQQEFENNSMFRQLENKYGDREQARSAMKMQQLQYAKTMAEHYAASNASNAVAVNLAKFLNEADAEFMKASEDFRTAEYGKRKSVDTQNYKEVAGRSAGWVSSEANKGKYLDNQLKRQRLAKGEQELAGAGGDEDKADFIRDRVARTKVSELGTARTKLRDLTTLMGGQTDAEGNYIQGSLDPNEISTFSTGAGATLWPEKLTTSKSVEIRKALENTATSVARARHGTKAASSIIEATKRNLISKWSTADTVVGLETIIKDVDREYQGALANQLPGAGRFRESIGGPSDIARVQEAQTNAASLGGRKDDF